ncbi:MAG TPA: I78 family peptidase inhibitor [Allosphingosinicella sp.]|jgi:hypothetical protein
MKALQAIALLVSASGCAAVPPAEEEAVPVHGDTGRRCDASKAQVLVGEPSSQALAAEAMRLTGAGIMRWIAEGAITTREYREDRLNIELDRENRVKAIRCG